MDWTKDFEMRFSGHKELQTLKVDGFKGSVEIHFNNGTPEKYKYTLWRGPKYRDLTK